MRLVLSSLLPSRPLPRVWPARSLHIMGKKELVPMITREKIEKEGIKYEIIKEGLASILVPESAAAGNTPKAVNGLLDTNAQQVFYNPIQQFNRDLSVLVIKHFAEWSRRTQKPGRHGRKGGKTVETSVNGTGPPPIDPAASSKRKRDPDDPEILPPAGDGPPSPKKTRSESPIQPFTIIDALSASGLRALRYAHEIPTATAITANDLSPAALTSIIRNISHNNLSHRILATSGDANAHMYAVTHRLPLPDAQKAPQKYNVIDLDPYGTAAPFFDAALQALASGGLLALTCTDASVFAGTSWPEKTFALYGGLPMKGPACHEAGLRLIVHALGTTAARYGLAIEPLLTLSVDFYARLFVRVRRSPASAKWHAARSMAVYNCDQGCHGWQTQMLARAREKGGFTAAQGANGRECESCGARMHVAGPMFAGPLHNRAFLGELVKSMKSERVEVYGTLKRVKGVLQTALEECAPKDSENEPSDGYDPSVIDKMPFFVSPQSLSATLHCQTPKDAQIRGALISQGYRVTRSHCKAGSIKTDAPWSVIWEVMRQYVKKYAPIKEGALKEGGPGWSILYGKKGNAKAVEKKGNEEGVKIDNATEGEGGEQGNAGAQPGGIDFNERLGKASQGGKDVMRYQINPAYWGPMKRAKGAALPSESAEHSGQPSG